MCVDKGVGENVMAVISNVTDIEPVIQVVKSLLI
jgi:hypothetical protein